MSPAERRAARERWALLSPYHRKLIAEEMPNELEREEEYRRRTFSALEWRNGPRVWDATIAVIAEGEADGEDRMAADRPDDDGMTLKEIGEELGLSRERVREIIACALGKLGRLAEVQAMAFGEPLTTTGLASPADIDAAIARALEAA